MAKRIAILGDFNPDYTTHLALSNVLTGIVRQSKEEIYFDWIGTDIFNYKTAFKIYKGLFIASGSPYKDMQNVLDTITYARQNNIPTLGNCGGFQHMIIEFARNVCGIENADHEETNPQAVDLVISKLACSLVEQEEELIITEKNSLLYKIVGKENFKGRYFCSYGLNPRYLETLKSKGLVPTSFSADGQMRSFELKSHRFFIGALFQPALTSSPTYVDPIIREFIDRC
jgi:CTP synthase (UTP-ammonia lyase)